MSSALLVKILLTNGLYGGSIKPGLKSRLQADEGSDCDRNCDCDWDAHVQSVHLIKRNQFKLAN